MVYAKPCVMKRFFYHLINQKWIIIPHRLIALSVTVNKKKKKKKKQLWRLVVGPSNKKDSYHQGPPVVIRSHSATDSESQIQSFEVQKSTLRTKKFEVPMIRNTNSSTKQPLVNNSKSQTNNLEVLKPWATSRSIRQ